MLLMDSAGRNELALQFGKIASQAGHFIMSIYAAGATVTTKPDGSPVSDADRGAERIIAEQLARILPDVPLVAEESFNTQRLPKTHERFLLVDPLDGTREFLSRNGEFTVNIALIENGQPVASCVYAPALGDIYLSGTDAFRAQLKPGEALPPRQAFQVLTTSSYPDGGLRAVTSRSHLDRDTERFLDKLRPASRSATGSSLKFCMIARG